MKITHLNDPFPHILISDIYEENELNLIWKELNFFIDKLCDPIASGSAMDENNKPLKRGLGIWLDNIFTSRETSNILSLNRKIFGNYSEIFSKSDHWFFKNIRFNCDTTLISYYENEDHYKPHFDSAYVTALTWFYKEPKKFEGGDLYFTDFNYQIEVKNNFTIIFPSTIKHSVSEVKMKFEDLNRNNGRVCMGQFMGISLNEN
jgi:hypothetical protein